ncbi:hypothetical protein AAG906_025538 [Vitis piasezkii]
MYYLNHLNILFVGVVPNWIVLESDGLLHCTKGCPDRWFGHAPPKIKVDDTVTIVLTIHSSLSYNDDYITYLGLDELIPNGLQVCLVTKGIRDRFHIPDNIPILLINDKALSSVDLPNNMMYFTKEQFVVGLVYLSLFLQAVPSFYVNPSLLFFPYSFLAIGVAFRFMQRLGKGHMRSNGPQSSSSRQNLLVLIDNPKSFIIPVFPRLTPPSLVPGEHFVLKDLLFYEVSHLADSEAR